MPLTKKEALDPLRAVIATLRALPTKTDEDREKIAAIRGALESARGQDAVDETSRDERLAEWWKVLRDVEALQAWEASDELTWRKFTDALLTEHARGLLIEDTEDNKLPSVTKVKNMLRRYARGDVTAAPSTAVEQAHEWGENVFDIVVDNRPSEVAYAAAIAAVDDSTTVAELTALAQQAADIARRAEARAERRRAQT